MSLKIYQAYIFDKNYTMQELYQMMSEIKQDIVRQVAEIKYQYIANHIVHYQDFLKVFGMSRVKDIYTKQKAADNKKLADIYQTSIWYALMDKPHDVETLQHYIEMYFDEKVYDDGRSNRTIDSVFDYNANVIIVPTKDRPLLMYFGNSDLYELVKNRPYLADYHYQNQVDKPDHISDEAWDERKNVWAEAIGPDYRPINHGFQFTLFSTNHDMVDVYPIKRECNLSLQERARWLLDYAEDYPNPPATLEYKDWIRYMRTSEYIEWKKAKHQEFVALLESE